MNTRNNFLAQAMNAIYDYDGYKTHMLLAGMGKAMIISDTMLIESESRKASSKSEGDDLIFKTTPKIVL
jgi:hypothetical protein